MDTKSVKSFVFLVNQQTLNRIEETTNVANTEKYIVFYGNSTRGIDVFYNHKQIALYSIYKQQLKIVAYFLAEWYIIF